MGYSTNFSGTLKFKKELTASQIVKVKSFLGQDCRQHPEWGSNLTFIDLQLTDDFSALEWDGSEKTYNLQDKVNLIIREMKKVYPDFELEGSLLAQGESIEDRWSLVIESNTAFKRDIALTGKRIKCPCCGEYFLLEA